MQKVELPQWWTGYKRKRVFGFTDAVDTYCCELTASWFVTVPHFEYEGYFHVKDLKLIIEKGRK